MSEYTIVVVNDGFFDWYRVYSNGEHLITFATEEMAAHWIALAKGAHG